MRGGVISFTKIIQKVFNKTGKDKDFDGWNALKKEIDTDNKSLKIKSGEIWWCRIGINVDCEQNGKNITYDRPVLIFIKLAKNKFYGIPLTTKRPRFDNYSHRFRYSDKTSFALLDQMRVLSTNRLEKKAGAINRRDYSIVKYKLGAILKYL